MIYLTQLIYIKEGKEKLFQQFEKIALPAMAKYGGRLLLRIRPTEDCFVGPRLEKPCEIHLVEFPREQDFEAFQQDGERRKFLHLKEESVRSVLLIKGVAL